MTQLCDCWGKYETCDPYIAHAFVRIVKLVAMQVIMGNWNRHLTTGV